MKLEITPHKVHLFFCTNVRENGEKSCGDSDDTKILADQLKLRFNELKMPVRITRTACLGPCAQGPNIMAYSQSQSVLQGVKTTVAEPGVWFQDVRVEDAAAIEAAVKQILDQVSPVQSN